MRSDFDTKIEKAGLVAGCVIRKDSQFLLVQQKTGSSTGLWNIPAGYVDKGETLEQAAIREVKEETGFEVSIKAALGVWHDEASESVKHAYLAKITAGELAIAIDEISDAQWFDYEKIKQMYTDGMLRAPWVFEALTKAELGVDHDQHYVTTKALIFSSDKSQLLVMRIMRYVSPQLYGLPGGHMDKGETPAQAIHRELMEELGIKIETLEPQSFFMHDNGKVVLGYVGTAPADLVLNPSNPEKEVGEWMTRDQLVTLNMPKSYVTFALENWPA